MAYEAPAIKDGTSVANADFSGSGGGTGATMGQFKFVKLNSSNKWARCSVLGERSQGVLQNKPKADEPATVVRGGVTKVEAGAAVTAGDLVMTDTSGRAVLATTGLQILGQAKQTAASAGQLISVELGGPNLGIV